LKQMLLMILLIYLLKHLHINTQFMHLKLIS